MNGCTCIEDLHNYMGDEVDTIEWWCANFGCEYCTLTHHLCSTEDTNKNKSSKGKS